MEKKAFIPAIVGFLLHIVHANSFFLSDDFNTLLRARDSSFFQLLFTGDGQFYRPMIHIFFNIFYSIFGLNVLPFHIFVFAAYGFLCFLVYHLARELGLVQNNALFAALIFSLHFCHTEALLWLSASSDIFMSIFCVLTIIFVLENKMWASVISIVLALLSKESALFIVIILPFFMKKKKQALIFLPILLFALFRLPSLLGESGDSYVLSLGFSFIANLAFFVTAMFFPLNFSAISQQTSSPLQLPIFVIFSVVLSFLLFGGLIYFKRSRKYALMSLLLFAPFLMLSGSGYRLLLFPSVFFCIAVGRLWEKSFKSIFIVVPLLLGFSIFSAFPWAKASRTTKIVSDTIELSDSDCFYAKEIPDNYDGAYVFRNGLPSLAALHGKEFVAGVSSYKLTFPDFDK